VANGPLRPTERDVTEPGLTARGIPPGESLGIQADQALAGPAAKRVHRDAVLSL